MLFSFCCTKAWISYICTYISSLLGLPPSPHPSPPGHRRAQSRAPRANLQLPCSCLSVSRVVLCMSVHSPDSSCPALPCPTHRVCKSILEVSVSLFLNSNTFCIYVFNCVYTEYMQILSTQQTPSFFNKWKTMYGSVITSRRELRR